VNFNALLIGEAQHELVRRGKFNPLIITLTRTRDEKKKKKNPTILRNQTLSIIKFQQRRKKEKDGNSKKLYMLQEDA
jgi:hypothetical protein